MQAGPPPSTTHRPGRPWQTMRGTFEEQLLETLRPRADVRAERLAKRFIGTCGRAIVRELAALILEGIR
jgi:hypothetical protein